MDHGDLEGSWRCYSIYGIRGDNSVLERGWNNTLTTQLLWRSAGSRTGEHGSMQLLQTTTDRVLVSLAYPGADRGIRRITAEPPWESGIRDQGPRIRDQGEGLEQRHDGILF